MHCYTVHMKTYNLAEAAALLGVDASTLRRWRASAGGAGSRGPADRRRVWLSRAELAALARAHGRVLLDAAAPGGDVVELAALAADLAREIADLRARVAALESAISASSYTG